MPITYAFELSIASRVEAKTQASGIQAGPRRIDDSFAVEAGADAATQLAITAFSGGYVTASVAGVVLAIATLTNPGGSFDYEPLGGTSPLGSKLKYIWALNEDPAIGINVVIPATLGLAGLGWVANGHVARLDPSPGGKWELVLKSGSSTLVTGSNDGLKFVADSGTPRLRLRCGFG